MGCVAPEEYIYIYIYIYIRGKLAAELRR